VLIHQNDREVPVYDADIYSRHAITDPYPHYTRLRQLGPVVWLSRQRVYALPRYAECKTVFRDDTTFISCRGVAVCLLMCGAVGHHVKAGDKVSAMLPAVLTDDTVTHLRAAVSSVQARYFDGVDITGAGADITGAGADITGAGADITGAGADGAGADMTGAGATGAGPGGAAGAGADASGAGAE
jgi:hypothetical protein